MSPDWRRLADYVEAELARRGWTRVQLAAEAGVGTRTVDRLLGGGHIKLPYTTPKIEKALGWTPGTARRILEGGVVEESREKKTYDLTPGEFRVLLTLLRERIEREPGASDADRARWHARVDELEADMLGESDQRAG